MTRPNGLAFSPDEKLLYVAQSDETAAIWRVFDVKPDGTIANSRVFFDATTMAKTKKGLPDGMKIDTEGNLFATGPGGVLVFSPQGKHLGTIVTGQATSQLRLRRRRAHAVHDRRLLRDARPTEGEGQGLLKALLLSEPGILSVVEVPTPVVGEDEVLVRVRACGVCGSDVHGYDGSTGRRIPPLVMGHEAAGVIERIGSRVDRPRTRRSRDLRFDRVVRPVRLLPARPDQPLRSPYGARRLVRRLPPARRVCGIRRGAGAHRLSAAGCAAVRARRAHRGRLGGGARRRPRTPPAPGDHVVVIGCGMIGLLVIQTLREKGCTSILAVDIDRRRSAMAMSLGATAASSMVAPTCCTWFASATGGGADHAFEVVGLRETVLTAVRSVRKGGDRHAGRATSRRPSSFPLQEIVSRQLTLFGSCASSGEYPACIDLMTRGAIDVAPLITRDGAARGGARLVRAASSR